MPYEIADKTGTKLTLDLDADHALLLAGWLRGRAVVYRVERVEIGAESTPESESAPKPARPRKTVSAADGATPTDGEIMDAIRAGKVTTPKIADSLGADPTVVSRALSKLSRAGKVENQGTRGPGAKWQECAQPTNGAAA